MELDDFFNLMEQVKKASEGKTAYIPLNPLAQAHIKWLVENGHLHPENVSIQGVMDADKKLGITPWDWSEYT